MTEIGTYAGYRSAVGAGHVLPHLTPTVPHQSVAHLLVQSLRTAARRAGLGVHGGALLRVSPERLLLPDLMVVRTDRVAAYAEASDTVLVGEVTPPGASDAETPSRVGHYADAGIPWFLVVQPETPEYRAVSLRLFHREAGRYHERASARPGQMLLSKAPFPFRIRAADLVIF